MEGFNQKVHYLEDFDFDEVGNLTNKQIPKNMLVLIMIQSSSCGHCDDAKPLFQDFANEMSDKVFCATIQTNGYKKKKTEIPLGERLNKFIPDFKGVPDYALYKNGKIIDTKTSGRNVELLKKFCAPHLKIKSLKRKSPKRKSPKRKSPKRKSNLI